MTPALLDLLRAARGAGVRISAAEAIDAAGAAAAVGWADRAALRDALTMTVAKTVDEQALFRECFDRFFRRDAPTLAAAAPAAGRETRAAESLTQMLLAGDEAAVAQAMEGAGQAVGVGGISLFTQTNLFARRMLDRMGLDELDRDIAGSAPEMAASLEAARGALVDNTRAFVERQLALFGEGPRRELREASLRAARLSSLDRRDLARMQALARRMAKRLAARYGQRRYRARRGQLDAGRTLRVSLHHDGMPFRPLWRRRRVDRTRLVALCDVSGSVANVSRFLLLFLAALHEALDGMRAFAFTGETIEVTGVIRRERVEDAMATIMDTIGYGSSNYGRSLAMFDEKWREAIDRRTTLLILGDARGNRTDPRLDVMRGLFGRAKRVIWLNPEGRMAWGSGDSDMLRYLPLCHRAATCGTIAELETALDALLSGSH